MYEQPCEKSIWRTLAKVRILIFGIKLQILKDVDELIKLLNLFHKFLVELFHFFGHRHFV